MNSHDSTLPRGIRASAARAVPFHSRFFTSIPGRPKRNSSRFGLFSWHFSRAPDVPLSSPAPGFLEAA